MATYIGTATSRVDGVAKVTGAAKYAAEFNAAFKPAAEVGELRDNGLAGSPDKIVDRIATFAEVGASRLYLQVLDLADVGRLADIADGVLRQLP